jgi:hypothetical protein
MRLWREPTWRSGTKRRPRNTSCGWSRCRQVAPKPHLPSLP